MEEQNFFVNEDFKFKLGSSQVEVLVPRVLFKDAKKVLDLILSVVVDDLQLTMRILSETSKAEKITEKKPYNALGKVISEVLPKLIIEKNHGKLHEFITILSAGKITSEIVDTMQYNEICSVIAYLVDKNFDSLKNLQASLNQITMCARHDSAV